MSSERARLTEGPVGKHLVTMTVPVLLGIMTMMAQALIDAFATAVAAATVIARTERRS